MKSTARISENFASAWEYDGQAMRVYVSGYITFRPLIGKQRELQVQGDEASLPALLDLLSDEIGEAFERIIYDRVSQALRPGVALLVNGRHMSHLPEGLNTPVHDGDEIAIFPPVAGG